MNNFERASKIVDFCNLLKLLDYKICCHLNSNKINYIFPSTKKKTKRFSHAEFYSERKLQNTAKKSRKYN